MKNSKIAEVLWTLVLLTAFVVGSFALLLLGANYYQTMTNKTSQAREIQLPISYIATTIRQANKDQVTLEEKEGIECLVITYDNHKRIIYLYDGELRELFVSDNATYTLNDGTKIAEIDSLEMDLKQNELIYKVNVDDTDFEMKVVMR